MAQITTSENRAGISNLWKSLCEELFAKVDDDFLATFREPGRANSRLAAWDPLDRTMRYFKFLLYSTAERQPDRFFDLYRALGDVDLGNPVSVSVRSCNVNIDHLLAVEEFLFVDSAIDTGSLRSIIEIGGGFGRTCHAFVALAGAGLESYTIVDLPPVLELSRRALVKLAPAHYEKIRFVDATDPEAWRSLSADLIINIDSFQEMPAQTVDAYMRDLIVNCATFYVKNPIGKYDPASVGLTVDPAKLEDVLSLGYCRDILDIFNDEALAAARSKYREAYRPGPNWDQIADRPMDLFAYYHHCLYRRDDGANSSVRARV